MAEKLHHQSTRCDQNQFMALVQRHSHVVPNHYPHKSLIILPCYSRYVQSSPASDVLVSALAPSSASLSPKQIPRTLTCNSNCRGSIHQLQQEAKWFPRLLTSLRFCEFWVKCQAWQFLWGQSRLLGPPRNTLEVHPQGSHHSDIEGTNLCQTAETPLFYNVGSGMGKFSTLNALHDLFEWRFIS